MKLTTREVARCPSELLYLSIGSMSTMLKSQKADPITQAGLL